MPAEPKLNRRARRDQRIVDEVSRRRNRRDREDSALDEIKRELVQEALASGATTSTKINPKTGESVTVYQVRNGAPISVTAIAGVLDLLKTSPGLVDKLFPPVIRRRGFDWTAIDEFLRTDAAPESPEQQAQLAITAAMEQRTTWAAKRNPPKRRRCVICNAEMAWWPVPLNLCETHREWFSIDSLQRLMKDGKLDPSRFNDPALKVYRGRRVKDEYADDYEAAVPARRRRKAEPTPEPAPAETPIDAPAETPAE